MGLNGISPPVSHCPPSPPGPFPASSRCIRRCQGYYLSSGMGAAPVPLTIAAPETLFLPGDSINHSPWHGAEGGLCHRGVTLPPRECLHKTAEVVESFPTTAPSWDVKPRTQLPGMTVEGTGGSVSPSETRVQPENVGQKSFDNCKVTSAMLQCCWRGSASPALGEGK